jgi:hypothetical protein
VLFRLVLWLARPTSASLKQQDRFVAACEIACEIVCEIDTSVQRYSHIHPTCETPNCQFVADVPPGSPSSGTDCGRSSLPTIDVLVAGLNLALEVLYIRTALTVVSSTIAPGSCVSPRAKMATRSSFENLGLSIIGVGTQYPPYALKPDCLDTLSREFYPESPAQVTHANFIPRSKLMFLP